MKFLKKHFTKFIMAFTLAFTCLFVVFGCNTYAYSYDNNNDTINANWQEITLSNIKLKFKSYTVGSEFIRNDSVYYPNQVLTDFVNASGADMYFNNQWLPIYERDDNKYYFDYRNFVNNNSIDYTIYINGVGLTPLTFSFENEVQFNDYYYYSFVSYYNNGAYRIYLPFLYNSVQDLYDLDIRFYGSLNVSSYNEFDIRLYNNLSYVPYVKFNIDNQFKLSNLYKLNDSSCLYNNDGNIWFLKNQKTQNSYTKLSYIFDFTRFTELYETNNLYAFEYDNFLPLSDYFDFYISEYVNPFTLLDYVFYNDTWIDYDLYTTLLQNYNELNQDYQDYQDSHIYTNQQYNDLNQDYQDYQDSHSYTNQQYDDLQSDYNDLNDDYLQVISDYDDLNSSYNNLLQQYNNLKNSIYPFNKSLITFTSVLYNSIDITNIYISDYDYTIDFNGNAINFNTRDFDYLPNNLSTQGMNNFYMIVDYSHSVTANSLSFKIDLSHIKESSLNLSFYLNNSIITSTGDLDAENSSSFYTDYNTFTFDRIIINLNISADETQYNHYSSVVSGGTYAEGYMQATNYYESQLSSLSDMIINRDNIIVDLHRSINNLQIAYNDLNQSYQNMLNGNNFANLFFTIAETPFASFKQIWNVDFLGVNLAGFVTGILFLGLIIWVIKKIF